MAEIAPAGGGPNRTFIVLAIGLAALLVLGLLALGTAFLLPRLFGPPAAPTRVAIATPTRVLATPTIAGTPTALATDTATPTSVLSSGGAQTTVAPGGSGTSVAQGGTATPTVIGGSESVTGTVTTTGTPAPTGSGQLPQSGLGEDLLLLAGGVFLVAIIFVARRARTA